MAHVFLGEVWNSFVTRGGHLETQRIRDWTSLKYDIFWAFHQDWAPSESSSEHLASLVLFWEEKLGVECFDHICLQKSEEKSSNQNNICLFFFGLFYYNSNPIKMSDCSVPKTLVCIWDL